MSFNRKNNPPTETSPLRMPPNEAAITSSSHTKIRNGLKKSAQWSVQTLVGGITALQNATNAAAAPDDINTSQISVDWFRDLSPELKAFVIINATSSELVNAILNILFLQSAKTILSKLWDRQKTSSKERTIVLSELILAVDSAVTLGGIAADNSEFLPYHLNAAAASLSSITNFASRLTGIDNAVMRGRNLTNDNAKIQRDLYTALSHLVDKERAKKVFIKQRRLLNTQLENDDISDSDYNYKTLLANFIEELATTTESASFQKRTVGSKVLAGSGLMFDILLATYIAVTTFITFMQKGYQGKKDIWDAITHDGTNSSDSFSTSSDEASSLSPVYKALLGIPSGVTSGALYATRALGARDMIWDMGEYTVMRGKEHFSNSAYLQLTLLLLGVVILGAANYFASSSGFNMAEKIVENPATAIIPMEKGSVIADLYSYGNQLGVAAVNTDSTARKAFLNAPTHPDNTLTYEAFMREIKDPTKILITSASQDHARRLNELYEERQNEGVAVSRNPASFYSNGATTGLSDDPGSHPIDQKRPSQRITNTGINSAESMEAGLIPKPSHQRKPSN